MFCLCVCMYVCIPCACLVLTMSEEGISSSGNGVRGSCESPHECWEPHPGPLQEQQMLLLLEPFL